MQYYNKDIITTLKNQKTIRNLQNTSRKELSPIRIAPISFKPYEEFKKKINSNILHKSK